MRVLKLIIKKYPWWVMAPLVGGITLIGVSTAHTMYRAFSYTPPAISKGGEAATDTSQARPTLEHYAVIFQRDLFTSAVSAMEKSTEKDKTAAAASTAPFKLKGTVVVSPGKSAAIIEDPSTRKQELFHENDMVQGFKIVKILRNKVIVDKDGREEVVEVIEEEEKAAPSPVKRPRRPTRRPVRRPVPVPPAPKKPPEF